MPLSRFASKTSQQPTKIALRGLLVASFVVQIVAALGTMGYLSFGNGQIAVEKLAQESIAQTGKRVEEKLTGFLESSHWVNQLNALRDRPQGIKLTVRTAPARERVSAVDFSLWEIQQYLDRLKFSHRGQILIIQRSSLLVASSSQESTFRKMSGKPQPEQFYFVRRRSCAIDNCRSADSPVGDAATAAAQRSS